MKIEPMKYSGLCDNRISEFFDDVDDMALSEESKEISKACDNFVIHYLQPFSRQSVDISTRFSNLKSQWKNETAMLSSSTKIAMHPAYQQIIGMGKEVIPYILYEMSLKPGHWFWALKSITGEDPVLPEQRGRVKEMTQAWLNWGKSKGISY